MTVPIVFSRTARLSSPAATLTLASIPQTAHDLLFHVRARLDTDMTNNLFLGLRVNGDSSAVYRNVASYATTTTYATGIVGDGFNVTEHILAELNEAQGATAGMFTTVFGMIPRYSTAEQHAINGLGNFIFDDGSAESEYRRVVSGGYHNSAVAISSLVLMNETGANFAADTQLTVYGLAEAGDAIVAARSAGTLALDFEGDEFKDISVVAGANVFTATNARIGRTLQCKLTGGDGTTTLTLPTGTELIDNSYVAGQDAWLTIRCSNEIGPEFIATVKDIA